MSDAIEIITTAQNELDQLDLRNKDLVNSLLLSARRNVAIQLADKSIEGFKGAVDTMDKVKAIESYIKVKRGQGQAELVTQNRVAAERLRIVRDIGKWLEKYLAHKKHSNPLEGSNNDDGFWLEELGIDDHQSSDWQKAAEYPDEEFERWLFNFLDTAQKLEEELYLNKFLQYLRPRPEPEEKKLPKPEFDYRKYQQDLLTDASMGGVSREEVNKRIKAWTTTREYVETIYKQIGELY